MLALVQWALATPQDWMPIDLKPTGAASRAWSSLPAKPTPASAAVIDDVPGWLFSVVIQGVDIYGFDHVALEPIAGGGVRSYAWVDDADDPTFTYRWGEVWEFRPGSVDRTLDLGGGSSVRHRGPDQRKTIYAEDVADRTRLAPQECGGLPVRVLPWSQWPAPRAAIVRHGVWVHDEDLWRRHFAARRRPSWREWVA